MLLIKRPEYRCEMGEEGRKLELGKNDEGTLDLKSQKLDSENGFCILPVGSLVSRMDLCVG